MKKPKIQKAKIVADPSDPIQAVYLDIIKRTAEFGVKPKSIFIGVRCSEKLGFAYRCSLWAFGINFTHTCFSLNRLSDFVYESLNRDFPISENGERKLNEKYLEEIYK